MREEVLGVEVQLMARSTREPSRVARPRSVVLGLTGGVASGKSTVATMLEDLGATVIDADRLAHEALELPKVQRWLRARWGGEVFDRHGRPDRARIGQIVFADPDALGKLTRLVHPPVIRKIRTLLRETMKKRRCPMVVIDAPLLIEADLDRWCDAVVFIDAARARRAARARSARGWSAAELARREALQRPLDEKRRRALYVLDNNGGRRQLRAAVKRLFHQVTGTSAVRHDPASLRR